MHHLTNLALGVIAVSAAVLAPAAAATRSLTCGGAKTIAGELAKMVPGDTLQLSGVCIENVSVPARYSDIMIEGVNGAILQGATPGVGVILIRGRSIRIRNLTITGGAEGVQVIDGGFAWIENNTITANGSYGIQVSGGSMARIWSNQITNNGSDGIEVVRSAAAIIGVPSLGAATASPNNISGNARAGIRVSGSAHASIIGNTIGGNGRMGVEVAKGSHADIASNTIAANANDAITLSHNSTANLGNNSGTSIYDLPNGGSGNGLYGVSCFGGGYVAGRLGTLTGSSGTTDTAACAGVINP